MLKIALCDDESIIRTTSHAFISKQLEEQGISAIVDCFEGGQSLLASDTDYQLYFLDIDMPEMDGMTLAARIKERQPNALIIFVTSHEDMVYNAFEVKAFRFIPKAFDKSKLAAALDDAVKELDAREKDVLTLEIQYKRLIKVPFKDILYIETLGRKILIHCKTETHDVNLRMKEIEEQLSPKLFFRLHTSFIVNLEHVFKYDSKEVTLVNGTILQMSRLKLKDFKTAYIQHLKKGV